MIPDDLKRTINDFADKVMEGGKQIGNQAQLQVQLKKLQVEHARRIHELGKHTYDWYRAGTMIVSGPVPPDVSRLCAELDDIQTKTRETERQIEEAKAQMNPPDTPAVNAGNTTPPGAATPIPMPPGTPPASGVD
jgi:hypothetical protein